MLLWISLGFGVTLLVLALACLSAMVRAERRARRNLYATLGFNDEAVGALMRQKGSVSALLAQVRRDGLSAESPQWTTQERAAGASRLARLFRRPGLGERHRPMLAPTRRQGHPPERGQP